VHRTLYVAAAKVTSDIKVPRMAVNRGQRKYFEHLKDKKEIKKMKKAQNITDSSCR